ncbi:MAG: sigma-54-dependent Fis family transcriptional regulator [Nitrospirae bacterium]|nr:sigma-54-dependent Fis family transcriptional regulator [Nitrospirota bacterium]
MKPAILLIEDDEILRITVYDALVKKGWEVTTAADGYEASDLIKKNDYDIVVCDIRLPRKNGIELLQEVKKLYPETEVIMMTAYGKVEDAVSAMRLGAYDYITKPFSIEDLIMRIEKIVSHQALKREYQLLKTHVEDRYSLFNIIGRSKKMQALFDIIERVSKIDSNVIIMGESGTGKGLIASVIHQNSARKVKPFVKVNCAALTEALLESELFGHEKGAFTGAIRKRFGRFEIANGGTIFLDEVGDIPPSIQVKLLRVLQEHEFERVGGEETIKTDVRLISATKMDLEKLVEEGKFREDLFYRLKVIPIFLPPLRDRKEDIPLLVEHFLKKFNERLGRATRLSSEAMKTLIDYDFPGNIRELENIIERAVALSNGDVIKSIDLLTAVGEGALIAEKGGEIPSLKEVLSKTEANHLLRVLERTNWNKVESARILGISRKSLWEKLKYYKISSN